MGLSTDLAQIIQRSGSSTNTLATQAQRVAFSQNVRADIANIATQLNAINYVLFSALTDGTSGTTDALSLGLTGASIFTDATATVSSSSAYWDTTNVRARTVKETFDVILSELTTLANQVTVSVTASTYDDTAVITSINQNGLNLAQLILDTYGTDYSLTGLGLQVAPYPLAQHVDAIGAMFSGYTPTGYTYTGTFPALSLSIAQADVTNLVSHLAALRTFVGMDTELATPDYVALDAAVEFLANGQSLEQSVVNLDATLRDHKARHVRGGADSIVGDLLDIAYGPTSYTRTISGLGTDVEHLTAHLAGIDAALSALSVRTWQQIYDGIGASTFQSLQLLDANGYFRITADPLSASKAIFQVRNAATDDAFTVHELGVILAGGLPIYHEPLAAVPAALPGLMQIYSRVDGVTDIELFTQTATQGEIQVTRDARVKELEMGSEYVAAASISGNPLASGPERLTASISGTPADGSYEHLAFGKNHAEYGTFTVAPPLDENGDRASKFNVQLFTTTTKDGTGGGGSAWGFTLSTRGSSSIDALNDGDSLLPPSSWQDIGSLETTGLVASAIHKLYTLQYADSKLDTDGPLVIFRIRRDIGVANDWNEDVSVIGARVTWYR